MEMLFLGTASRLLTMLLYGDFSLETKLVPVRRRLAPDVTVSGHPDGVDNLEVDPDQCCETGSDGINKF